MKEIKLEITCDGRLLFCRSEEIDELSDECIVNAMQVFRDKLDWNIGCTKEVIKQDPQKGLHHFANMPEAGNE